MTNKGSVLYIEDNTENRILIKRVLEADGYIVLEASNASEALEKLEEHPDLILMDISMPEVDGYTLTAKIKNTPGCENLPIIALTAMVMRGDRERSLEAGCDGYIQKPVDIDILAQQLERYIRK